MDVAALVSQMGENLSAIHSTISNISNSEHVSRLDQLEQQRDDALSDLKTAYDQEQEQLADHRKKFCEETAFKRQKEDEEREARRRQEDEDFQQRNANEDNQRQERLEMETRKVEDEMDDLMDDVEAQVQEAIDESQRKLAELEAKRREINRLLDEQLKMPLVSVQPRKRSRRRQAAGAQETIQQTQTERVEEGDAPKPYHDGVPSGKATEPRIILSAPSDMETKSVASDGDSTTSSHPQSANSISNNLPQNGLEASTISSQEPEEPLPAEVADHIYSDLASQPTPVLEKNLKVASPSQNHLPQGQSVDEPECNEEQTDTFTTIVTEGNDHSPDNEVQATSDKLHRQPENPLSLSSTSGTAYDDYNFLNELLKEDVILQSAKGAWNVLGLQHDDSYWEPELEEASALEYVDEAPAQYLEPTEDSERSCDDEFKQPSRGYSPIENPFDDANSSAETYEEATGITTNQNLPVNDVSNEDINAFPMPPSRSGSYSSPSEHGSDTVPGEHESTNSSQTLLNDAIHQETTSPFKAVNDNDRFPDFHDAPSQYLQPVEQIVERQVDDNKASYKTTMFSPEATPRGFEYPLPRDTEYTADDIILQPSVYREEPTSLSLHVPPPPSDSEGSSPENLDFTPRDVTHVPWTARERGDSLAPSLLTLSSGRSSPIEAPEMQDPMIYKLWHRTTGPVTRIRNDSQASTAMGYDESFGAWEDPKSLMLQQQQQKADVRRDSGATGTLFQRMRNVFETRAEAGDDGSSESPVRSRPASSIFNPIARARSSIDFGGRDYKGSYSYLDARDDGFDESSSLMQSPRVGGDS